MKAAPALGDLGFLASHRGTNVQAVLDACKTGRLGARPVVVIGNNRDAEVLARTGDVDADAGVTTKRAPASIASCAWAGSSTVPAPTTASLSLAARIADSTSSMVNE